MILSIDCGTQSIRAILFSLDGEEVGKVQVHYDAYFSRKPGWAEQNADIYWQSLCNATKLLKKESPENFKKIKAVGVSTIRNTMVNMDRDGKVLRPCLTWLDQRAADNVFKPNFVLKTLFKIIGIRETLHKMERKGACNWIRQNEPDIWENTYKYVQISGFLNYKLTGNFTDSIASQIGYIPFDYKKQQWSDGKDLFEVASKIYPIEREKLPKLIKPGEKIGTVTKEAYRLTEIPVGIPIIACGSDKGCETLGMGVVDHKIASLSFGTTATVQTTVKKYIEPIRFFPAYPSVIPKRWNPEIEIYRGFWMINWFKKEFALKEVQEAENKNIPVEEILNKLLHNSPAGAMGLMVQPYWSPGLGKNNAKGAMIGFGDIHKKEHIYRAIIEGLCYSLLDGMQQLQKRGDFKFERITVSGGASQSDEICQIATDIFNLTLLRGKTHETSGLGAAIITAYGINEFSSLNDAVKKMVNYSDVFKPKPKNVKIYKSLFNEVYLKMYKKLEPLHKKIREITNYPEM